MRVAEKCFIADAAITDNIGCPQRSKGNREEKREKAWLAKPTGGGREYSLSCKAVVVWP